jgi:hypothetical protein
VSYKIGKKQRVYWTSENPMRAYWPKDLTWFPESVKTRKSEWLYYTLPEHPHEVKAKYVNKHPHLVRETLQLIADMIAYKTPTACVAEKTTLRVSHDGHIIVLPTQKVEFNHSGECNYVDLADLCKHFDNPLIKKVPSEDRQLMQQVHDLLKESMSKAVLDMLASHGIYPTPRADPADRELDLCGIDTLEELQQRLAEHPKYRHLVTDEHGEIKSDPEIEYDENDPVAVKACEIMQKHHHQHWLQLRAEWEHHFPMKEDDDEEIPEEILNESFTPNNAWHKELVQPEKEPELEPVASPVLLPGQQYEINGMTLTLTEADLKSIAANHVKSWTRAEVDLQITQTVFQTVWQHDNAGALIPTWQKVREHVVPRDEITAQDFVFPDDNKGKKRAREDEEEEDSPSPLKK